MARRNASNQNMTKMTKHEKSVLDMSSKEARNFFLKPESYCSIEMPVYFDFSKVIAAVRNKIDAVELCQLLEESKKQEGVNYELIFNKDGRHAWRPFQLIHPVLYVSLVYQITNEEHWKTIRERFGKFQSINNITCMSIPVQAARKRKDKAAQILEWWQGIEQRSLELALDYEYVFHADIADCYSSIYTHSIAWALHGKDVAKKNRRDIKLIGNIIDSHIKGMRNGQTNGIPQGSVLMDFIAEMVLGYADLLLIEKINNNITDYHILRYRDDYRIFVNNPQEGEAILKALTEVLIKLGLKFNVSKLKENQSIIHSSLKPDKLAWLLKRQEDKNLQKHLLLIHSHSIEYPNGGSLVVALNHFYEKIIKRKKVQNPDVLISIITDISCRNPRTISICSGIISKLLSIIKEEEKCKELLEKVHRKLSRFPNTGLMEIWLQRIGYFFNFTPKHGYEENLCKFLQNQQLEIWNNNWIQQQDLKNLISTVSLINLKELNEMKPVIERSEIDWFHHYV